MSRVFIPLIFVLAMAITLLTISPAMASGVGCTPGKLQFDDSSGNLEGTLHIINTGREISHYQVYAEDPYTDWFAITPSEFTLKPSQALAIKISVLRSNVRPGKHDAKICVVAFPDENDAKIATGAKVPVHISLSAPLPVSPETKSSPESAIHEPTLNPSVTAQPELAAGSQPSSDSPVKFELWIGIVLITLTATAVIIIFARRRKRSEA